MGKPLRTASVVSPIRRTGQLTRRDLFAAAALQGLLAGQHPIDNVPGNWAHAARELADALAAEIDQARRSVTPRTHKENT